jgi:regulator of ribonuclease activity A
MKGSHLSASSASTTTTRRLRFTPTCDLYDQYLDQARVPHSIDWRSLGGKSEFCGPAVTVKCYDDNSRIKDLLEQRPPASQQVLVVDAGGASSRCAVLGDVIADSAVQNGWAGIVVHGRVRDVAALEKLNIGILASGSPTPRKSTRRGEGQIQVTVEIGDVECSPGDIVFCDRDGILILRPDQLASHQYDTSEIGRVQHPYESDH